MPSKTQERIDARLEETQGPGSRRTHLGASIVGDSCARKIWYIFRWHRAVRFKARMIRLFDRGHREEERFVLWLRRAGIHTLSHDPETNEQFRVESYGGHFGGSLDAMLYDAPDMPGHWILGEFKTHNDKSFRDLAKNGVRKAKWQHYVQMQIYIYKRQLAGGLYMAINKNDDDIYTEFVYPDRETAERYLQRAHQIIEMRTPPPRISESSAWYECNFCDLKKVCHFGAPSDVNCRTCTHSVPKPDGTWMCEAYNAPLDKARQLAGCPSYAPIPG